MAKERETPVNSVGKKTAHTHNDDEQTALKTNQYRKSFSLAFVFFITWKQLTRSRVLFSTDSYEKNSVHRRR